MQLEPMRFRLHNWAAWDGEVKGASSDNFAPVSLRRRVSPLGQKTLQSAWNLVQSGEINLIFSSRHGEFCRTVSLLDSLAREDAVSPTDFSLSVHHGLVGLLSIAQKNHQGHTAIAGGPESFCYGLLEALSHLRENADKPVLFLHCDDILPEPYAHFNEVGDMPVVISMLIANNGEGEEIELSIEKSPDSTLPSHYAVDFLKFITSDSAQALSIGGTLQCKWARR